jgi:hypothetical protein
VPGCVGDSDIGTSSSCYISRIEYSPTQHIAQVGRGHRRRRDDYREGHLVCIVRVARPQCGTPALPAPDKDLRNEHEAKVFASSLLDRTEDVSAGTINPHTPRRVIAPAAIATWISDI